ncbi:MAG: UDP-N-acetylmuramate dehydrogenase [Patescibacteria group bacterium]|nr:UDP-N-acetylmuramate dehydrogenase [Patescibacteria group bacterium]
MRANGLAIKKNVSLKNYTTFKTGGPAKYFVEVKSKEELVNVLQWAREKNLPFFVLGGGSNLLVSDEGFGGLVIKMKNEKLEMKNQNLKSKILECGAGVKLADLLMFCLQEGLAGMEWAAGIPQATVGGAIRGNAGAFGETMGDAVREVEAIEMKNEKLKMKNDNEKFKIIKIKNKECGFSYKESIFKKNSNLIILSAVLQLKKKNKKEIANEIKKISEYRKSHHPAEPSAGSVFKNIKLKAGNEKLFRSYPEFAKFKKQGEIPAGWLIEKAGLAAKKTSGAMISEKHRNFIVNAGTAKSKDVVSLIKLAKQKVKNKFGVSLKEEIQYLK